MAAPILLVTNDDGIDCHFLHALVAALQKAGYETRVAAPKREHSWVSRAISRRSDVHVAEFPGFNCPAWSLNGTPTDCVNIALGHLLPEPPAAVVSGINISTNAGLPHILSSGTVAGALEGAFWGLPALAFSLEMPKGKIAEVREANGKLDGPVNDSLVSAAAHAAEFVKKRLAQPSPDPGPTVHNINFPAVTTATTPVVQTHPAKVRLGKLFARKDANCFHFEWNNGMDEDKAPDADLTVLAAGKISHSILDYSFLGA